MALGRYVITAPVTLPPGTATATANGQFGTVSWAGAAAAWANGVPQSFVAGQVIELDNGSSLYTTLNGLGVLRAYVQGQDDVGHAALSN